MPYVGSQPRPTAKIWISSRPSQKDGIEAPMTLITWTARSSRPPRHTAAITPTGMPTITASVSEAPASSSVLGNCRKMIAETVSPSK